MEYTYVRSETPRRGVRRLVIDRPPVNALSTDVYRDIRSAFESLRGTDCKVVELTGEGKVFCAGNDVRQFAEMEPEAAADMLFDARQAFWSVYDCPLPVVALVNGAALGSGFALASCCDIIIASDRATFGLPELNVGVLGGSKFGTRILPELAMRRLFFTAETVSAAEMVRLGAPITVVPHDELEEAARNISERISSKSARVLRFAKESLNRVEHLDLKAGYEYEQTYTIRMSAYPEAKIAANAFLEKRPANFDHPPEG